MLKTISLIIILVAIPFETYGFKEWFIRNGIRVQNRYEFPFIALLLTKSTICTGSLISKQLVITAGHCICGVEKITEVRFLSFTEYDSNALIFKVKDMFVDKKYSETCKKIENGKLKRRAYGGNDIGLITLKNPMSISNKMFPTKLVNREMIPRPGLLVYIVGYGEDTSRPQDYVGILKKGTSYVMRCRHRTYANPICVRSNKNKQIISYGDSGGPLLLKPLGPLIGVASGGGYLRSIRDNIAVYANVANHLKFIRSYL